MSEFMKKNFYQVFGFVLLLGISGCMQSSSLLDHSFDGKNVAVVSDIPDAPFANFDMTIFDSVGEDVPLGNRGPDGRELPPSLEFQKTKEDGASQVPATPVHKLIDSVLVSFDMSSHIVNGAYDRSASLMRFEQLADVESADYLFEVIVEDYGIGSDAWQSTAFFEVIGHVKIIENKTGKRVWEGAVRDVVPLSKALLSVGIPGKEMETPAALSRVPVSMMQDVLAGLARYASIQLTAPLREAYQKSQDRESATMESQYTAN